jgi:uncharacterized repeat protein (TIGR03803 family)
LTVVDALIVKCNRLRIGFATALIIFTATFAPSASAAPQEKVLHRFSGGGDGSVPFGNLLFDPAGNLFGTTAVGGVHNWGVVFELLPQEGGGWTEKVLHSFNLNGTDGIEPQGGLARDVAGNLYGATVGGGDYNCFGNPCGTVFELTPGADGSWKEKILHSFQGSDGDTPVGALIIDAAGNLYGTTAYGGYNNCANEDLGCGTVFELMPEADGSWKEKVLYKFNADDKHGSQPFAGLIFDNAGNLYGTTVYGGTYDEGTVFELLPEAEGRWTEKVLHSFGKTPDDGINSTTSLILDAAGNLYGTNSGGGGAACYNNEFGCGNVFELIPKADGGWMEKVLHTFSIDGPDGFAPYGSLTFDAAGNLYGTTSSGGAYFAGTAFELTPTAGGDWIEKVLHNFGNGNDGGAPYTGLIFDAADHLYGTTGGGGIDNHGTVFELIP